ncbi:hypothetical protein [Paenibacillus ferrarius]|nr:hypothetical protein [Paenibacillus ferrarius]
MPILACWSLGGHDESWAGVVRRRMLAVKPLLQSSVTCRTLAPEKGI